MSVLNGFPYTMREIYRFSLCTCIMKTVKMLGGVLCRYPFHEAIVEEMGDQNGNGA